MKKCIRCSETKELAAFSNTPNGNKRHSCRTCMSKLQSKRTASKKEMDIVSWTIHRRYVTIKSKYGVTREEYEEMLAKQGGVCAICKRPNRTKKPTSKTPAVPAWLAVDHCHTTGKVRGLLCNPCNTGIAMLNDSADLLSSAAEYLRKNK